MNKQTILYVDDEVVNLMGFKASFRRDFNVLTAQNAQDALNTLKQEKEITIIISDQKMQGINGIDLLFQVREKYPKIRRIMLTGYSCDDIIDEAGDDSLIQDCFSKPLYPITLINILKKFNNEKKI